MQPLPDRFAIAGALREIAILLRINGENVYKTRAYERAADAVEHLSRDLSELVERRELTSIPGIGQRLAETIEELWRTGRSRLQERLRAQFPPGIAELISVPHLGIKKIATLHLALGITNRADLKEACETGRVRTVPGFGPKLEQRILAGLAAPQSRQRDQLLYAALRTADVLLSYLRTCPEVERAEAVGGVRRRQETVDTLDLIAATARPADVLDHFLRFAGSIETVARGAGEASIRLSGGLVVILHAVAAVEYTSARHFLTGSAAHVEKLIARAHARHLRLTPAGLWTDSNERLPLRHEADIYRQLGLQPVAPELRENAGEIEAAAAGTLPRDLIRLADIQGILHAHTVYSDGKHTVEEMARAAEAMGMKYLTITDHSQSAAYARGVTLDRLERQWEEIARVQERVGIHLLRGTEADILADGSLDYPDAILEQFDIIIASIHSRHAMDAEAMTHRVVHAMRHPLFKIWGHPLGRLLNKRPPFACDIERILDVIAEARAAIEINGDPHRLDLEPRWVRLARERRIRFVLSTDAHSVNGLHYLRFAVSTARRGWVGRDEVLNTLTPEAFSAVVRPGAGHQ